MPEPLDIVSSYFLAKDGNKPHLTHRVFTERARLDMAVKTDVISFPAAVRGRSEITEVLVRRFAREFENVYTFGLSLPTSENRRRFPCPWLVGMSAKQDGAVRVGCGRYEWHFANDESGLVNHLVITIDEMDLLPASTLGEVMSWLSALPYPWCTPAEATAAMPQIDILDPVTDYLRLLQAGSQTTG